MSDTELSFLPSDMISSQFTNASSSSSSSDQSPPSTFSSNSSLSLSLESFYTESVSNLFTSTSYNDSEQPEQQSSTSLSNCFTSRSSFITTSNNYDCVDYEPISYSQFEILTSSTNLLNFDETYTADEPSYTTFYDPTLYSHASSFDHHDVASSCDLRPEIRLPTMTRVNPPIQHDQQIQQTIITHRQQFQLTSNHKESFKLVERVQPKKSRTKYTKDQIDVLEASFSQNAYPDLTSVEQLAKMMGICKDKINIWFQNRRARSKKQ